jgi:5-hydroxyisourate hydrolase-like protein (transthyretin family)
MTSVLPRRFGALALAGLLLALVAACGGGGEDGRVRNVKVMVGQPCTVLGQTKTVSKVLNVCGRQGDALVWFAAKSRSPKGAKCTRPGGYRVIKGKSVVCATINKKRMWIEVLALPASLVGSSTTVVSSDSTANDATAQPNSDASAAGVVPSRPIDAAEAEAVAKASSPATRLSLATKPAASRNGDAVSPAPTVQLVDESGSARPIEGVAVRVVTASADHTITGGEGVTSADGSVSFPNLSILGEPGRVDFAFVTDNYAGVTQGVNHVAGAPSAIRFVERLDTAIAGEEWRETPIVRLTDVAGVGVTTEGVVLNLKGQPEGKEAKTLATATTNADGVASFEVTRGGPTSMGTWTLVVETEDGKLKSEPFDVAVSASTARRLRVSTTVSEVFNGIPVTDAITIQVEDNFRNAVKQDNMDITVKVKSNIDGSTHTVSTNRVVTNADGRATLENFTLTGTAGSVVLWFSVEAGGIVSARKEITLLSGPAANIALAVAPQGVRSGLPFDVSPQVEITDSSGNRVPVSSGTVAAVVDNGVTLTNATAEFGDDHLAKFENLTATGSVGDIKVTFTYAEFSVSSSLVMRNGPLEAVKAVEIPSSVKAGEEFGASIALFDAESNPVLDEGIVMTVKGPSGVTELASVSGTTGTVDFSGIKIKYARETTLRFEVLSGRGDKLLVLTGIVRVVPADAAAVKFLDIGDITVRNGEKFAKPIRVETLDRFGNAATTAGVRVRADVVSGRDNLMSILSLFATTDSGGIATFSDLRLTGKVGEYGLSFGVDGGVASNYPGVITLTAGVPAAFILERGAAGFVNGKVATVQPIVQLIDSARNPSPTAGVSVSAGFTGKANSIIVQTGNDGRALFSGLTYADVITPQLRLEYLSPGIGALTQSVVVTPGVPVTLTTALVKGGRIPSGTAVGTLAAIDLDGNATSLDTYTIELYVSRNDPSNQKHAVWLATSPSMSWDGQGRVTTNAVVYGALETQATFTITIRGAVTLTKNISITMSSDPKPGDPSFSGGVIVGELQVPVIAATGVSDGGRLLEIPPADWWKQAGMSAVTIVDPDSFSRTGIKTSAGLGTGPTNTRALMIGQSNRPVDFASFSAANATIRGLSDWFLPSKDEMAYIIKQLSGKASAAGWEFGNKDFLTSTLAGLLNVWVARSGVLQSVLVSRPGTVVPVRAFG